MNTTLSQKIDGFKKGWKRHTTSGIFLALVSLAATKGIDLSLYVESVESVYLAVSAAYASIMVTLKAISKDG